MDVSQPKVVIAGGSGLIGRALSRQLTGKGYEVHILSRSGGGAQDHPWDGKTVGAWGSVLEGAAAVVNLAGRSVNCKWTDANRREIISSRQDSTRAIGDAVLACAVPPLVWINGSAIGFYGPQNDSEARDESSPVGQGFLAETTEQWEAEMFDHAAAIRKVAIRTGVVLSREGGALVPLETLTKFFLGGQIGRGEQWMSWIHIEDLAAMFVWAIESEIEGVVNGVAAGPVTNAEFMAGLSAVMKRPWSPPAPSFAVRAVCSVFGPDPSLVLDSLCVVPKRAFEAGFQWKYPMFHNFAGVPDKLFALDALYGAGK